MCAVSGCSVVAISAPRSATCPAAAGLRRRQARARHELPARRHLDQLREIRRPLFERAARREHARAADAGVGARHQAHRHHRVHLAPVRDAHRRSQPPGLAPRLQLAAQIQILRDREPLPRERAFERRRRREREAHEIGRHVRFGAAQDAVEQRARHLAGRRDESADLQHAVGEAVVGPAGRASRAVERDQAGRVAARPRLFEQAIGGVDVPVQPRHPPRAFDAIERLQHVRARVPPILAANHARSGSPLIVCLRTACRRSGERNTSAARWFSARICS